MNKITIKDKEVKDNGLGFSYRYLTNQDFPITHSSNNPFEYFLIISGSIQYITAKDTEALYAGDLILFRNFDTGIILESHHKKCEVINIGISKEHFDSCCSYISNNIDLILTSANLPRLHIAKYNLPSVVQKHDFFNLDANNNELSMKFKLLLVDIFSLFLVDSKNEKSDHMMTQLENMFDKMNSLDNIEEGVPAMLRITGFSHGHLCRLMQNYLNMTPKQYLTELRLNYASNLLTNSTMDILTISFKVGYTSLSHFISIFKDKYGVTPLKYRQLHSK